MCNIKSCQYMCNIKSCQYMCNIKSCQCMWNIKSCQYMCNIKSCQYLCNIKSCQYMFNIKSCQYMCNIKIIYKHISFLNKFYFRQEKCYIIFIWKETNLHRNRLDFDIILKEKNVHLTTQWKSLNKERNEPLRRCWSIQVQSIKVKL
jgi:hypothetical protein